jgi:hypothetical protein
MDKVANKPTAYDNKFESFTGTQTLKKLAFIGESPVIAKEQGLHLDLMIWIGGV